MSTSGLFAGWHWLLARSDKRFPISDQTAPDAGNRCCCRYTGLLHKESVVRRDVQFRLEQLHFA